MGKEILNRKQATLQFVASIILPSTECSYAWTCADSPSSTKNLKIGKPKAGGDTQVERVGSRRLSRLLGRRCRPSVDPKVGYFARFSWDAVPAIVRVSARAVHHPHERPSHMRAIVWRTSEHMVAPCGPDGSKLGNYYFEQCDSVFVDPDGGRNSGDICLAFGGIVRSRIRWAHSTLMPSIIICSIRNTFTYST